MNADTRKQEYAYKAKQINMDVDFNLIYISKTVQIQYILDNETAYEKLLNIGFTTQYTPENKNIICRQMVYNVGREYSIYILIVNQDYISVIDIISNKFNENVIHKDDIFKILYSIAEIKCDIIYDIMFNIFSIFETYRQS